MNTNAMNCRTLSFHGDETVKEESIARLAEAIVSSKVGEALTPSAWMAGSSNDPTEVCGFSASFTSVFDGAVANYEMAEWHVKDRSGTAKHFALELAKAIPVGIDLHPVVVDWFQLLLNDPVHGLARYISAGNAQDLYTRLDALHRAERNGTTVDTARWRQLGRDVVAAVDASKADGSTTLHVAALEAMESGVMPLSEIYSDLLLSLSHRLKNLALETSVPPRQFPEAEQALLEIGERLAEECGPAPAHDAPDRPEWMARAMSWYEAEKAKIGTRYPEFGYYDKVRSETTSALAVSYADRFLALLRSSQA
ncbi:hypothetical protein SAMN05428967_4183 [Phyllobacterium sp. YR620]|uniref:hypothetical protein n=1 Tax=Phyllobacterium sp. YR620 TaxID=1881066 RepID=UPI00088F4201|nr:hypothetical protein [Phyllobacterium sp. YR620]SDP89161.1 hypothetical protein SAMN05428967_4183 [Phyllobacterium sp. YR620]